VDKLSGVPGVQLIGNTAPGAGLAASEQYTLQVADTPMVVLAREVLGGAFRHFSEHAGHEAVLQAGLAMGRLAASAVQPLIERLGLALTPDLLRRRVLDLQVFGWAKVQQVSVSDSLQGTLELSHTFEASAWNGQVPAPTGDFLRGFMVGVFSFAHNRPFISAEPSCEGRGRRRSAPRCAACPTLPRS
jgi:predicted hydrocarbon binding protein